MSLESLIMLAVSVLMGVYLMYALLRPEQDWRKLAQQDGFVFVGEIETMRPDELIVAKQGSRIKWSTSSLTSSGAMSTPTS